MSSTNANLSTQAAEVATYCGARAGDMAKFIAKIRANNYALAPYVRHIVFTADIDSSANSGLLPMVAARAQVEQPPLVCSIALRYCHATLTRDHEALFELRRHMHAPGTACGNGCVFSREWAVCKNVRSVTMPLSWAHADISGHTPIWQLLGVDIQRQYKYKYKGVPYIVIGDTKAPGLVDEPVPERCILKSGDIKGFLERLCMRGSKLAVAVKHLTVDLNPADLSPCELVQLFSSDEYHPSLIEAEAMGWKRFIANAVHALFRNRNAFLSLVLPMSWIDAFEESHAFPQVDFTRKHRVETSNYLVFTGANKWLSEACGQGIEEENKLGTAAYEAAFEGPMPGAIYEEDPGWDAVHESDFGSEDSLISE